MAAESGLDHWNALSRSQDRSSTDRSRGVLCIVVFDCKGAEGFRDVASKRNAGKHPALCTQCLPLIWTLQNFSGHLFFPLAGSTPHSLRLNGRPATGLTDFDPPSRLGVAGDPWCTTPRNRVRTHHMDCDSVRVPSLQHTFGIILPGYRMCVGFHVFTLLFGGLARVRLMFIFLAVPPN